MVTNARLGRNLLFAFILSVFVLPLANAGLVEIYINDSVELTESETEVVIEGGKNLDLIIQLSGPYRIDSDDKDLAIESIYIDVYFDSDTDRRTSTSGLPQYQPLKDTEADPGYDTFISAFKGDDTRFKDYEGPIRFSIIMKNSSSEIVRDFVILIEMESPPSGDSGSSGFSLPELPPVIADNLIIVVGGFVGLVLLSLLIYQFVLAPEDTTADVYRKKESVDPLKSSLTGVGYESELPSESKLKRLEKHGDDKEEEEDEESDEEYEYEDDGDEDEEFDERAMLDKLTGTQTLDETKDDDEGDEKPAPKRKAVKKKVAKKTIAKKKVVRKAAPAKKTTAPETNMGQGIVSVTCPSCEKVHNVDKEDTMRFICSCGRRIRL